jgi:glycosyltransferase involved in cell wall biosynthesis
MKVLFPYCGDTVGGSHISSLLLVKALSEYTSIQPSVVIHQTGQLQQYLDENQINYSFFPENIKLVKSGPIWKQLWLMFKSAVPLSGFLRKHNIDIVHTNDQRMHLTWLFAAKLAGCRFIWHQRTVCPYFRYGVFSLFADKVVTISHFCKNNMSKFMADRAQIIENPVNIDIDVSHSLTKKALIHEMKLPDHSVLIGWFANWIERKRPIDVVELAVLAKANNPQPMVFLMFGEAREPLNTVVMDRISELDIEDRVFIMGTRSPIEPYIAACDVLISTAENEGLGRTLIEAMLLETPVVATADGGHREIITDGVNGRLVPLGNTDAMLQAIDEVINNPGTTEKMVGHAKESAMSKYSLTSHVNEMLHLYKSL